MHEIPFRGITLPGPFAHTRYIPCGRSANLVCPPSRTHEYATRAAILKKPKSPTESKDSGRANSEFGAVTIDFNPGPDAEERLRRLFTLLLNNVGGEGQSASQPEGSGRVAASDQTVDQSDAKQSW